MTTTTKPIQPIRVVQNSKLIAIPTESWEAFQLLCHRAGNLWPDAPPAIKEFIDVVTIGHVQQDYYHQANEKRPGAATKEYHSDYPALEKTMTQDSTLSTPEQFNFTDSIRKFNAMYGMGRHELNKQVIRLRLEQVKKMLADEVDEVDEIIASLDAGEYVTATDLFTDIADWLGDIQVYCASELERFNIPNYATLAIIMESNFSKLQPDGTAKFVDGKLQKGPNYWKPEPRIWTMLAEYQREHPTHSK